MQGAHWPSRTTVNVTAVCEVTGWFCPQFQVRSSFRTVLHVPRWPHKRSSSKYTSSGHFSKVTSWTSGDTPCIVLLDCRGLSISNGFERSFFPPGIGRRCASLRSDHMSQHLAELVKMVSADSVLYVRNITTAFPNSAIRMTDRSWVVLYGK